MSDTLEINFDGLVGPTHNFAGLSHGNLACTNSSGQESAPRDAALEGLSKMRRLIDLGIPQGFLPPLRRPATGVLERLGYRGSVQDMLASAAAEDPELLVRVFSTSSMWTANAATVIASPDSSDGRIHIITSNLGSMFHRAIEADETHANLRTIFADPHHFRVHAPLPFGHHLGDEGAANHMRLASAHGACGVNLFVYGEEQDGRFPGRQSRRASQAVARIGGLDPDRTMFIRQASAAIQAGAFHNDVVAVANGNVLLTHAEAFEDQEATEAAIRQAFPELCLLRVEAFPLSEAVATYFFNSQLVTLPDNAGMALILPEEVRSSSAAWAEVERILAEDNPVTRAEVVDVRGSMRNGGGPACLRLRVPASAAARSGISQRFLLDYARLDALGALIERWWPKSIAPSDLLDRELWSEAAAAHDALERLLTHY